MTDSFTFQPSSIDEELERVLQDMLDCDATITARGVIRRHSKLKAASSIIRDQTRIALLKRYQEKQKELRHWQGRIGKISKASISKGLATRDMRITALEQQVELLTASHLAMIRVIGELGGYSKWARLFQEYQSVRNALNTIGAMPCEENK